MSISDRLNQIEQRANAAAEALAEYGDDFLWVSTRDWSAWGHGTMGADDFEPLDGDGITAIMEATAADMVPALVAAVRAALDMHQPRHEHALAAACSTESCDCEDGCRTVPTEVCGHCIDTGMSAHHYAYEEGGIETVLWPCPTVRAIATALGEGQS